MNAQVQSALELVSAAFEEAMAEHGILPQARTVIRATAEARLEAVMAEPEPEVPPLSPAPFEPIARREPPSYGTRPPRIERLW